MREVGVVGAVVSKGTAGVVALLAADWTEVFPAASYAETVYEYEVEGVRAVLAYAVVREVAICVPFRYMR